MKITGVSLAIIALGGGYQTYKDYKKADPSCKKACLKET